MGFRFTARAAARGLGLAGWAANLPDGRVEVVCEGEEKDLITFLDKMKNGPMNPYITDADVAWGNPEGEAGDFGIKY